MTRNDYSPEAAALATMLMLLVGLWPGSVQACSLASVEWSKEESIRFSMYYLVGSAVLGAMCIAAAVYRGRWIVTVLAVAVVLVFHPWWTVPPLYAPDCTFQNVEASELVLALLGVLFSYHLFRILKSRVGSRPDG